MGTWGTIKGFIYLALFGLAGYAVLVDDRVMTAWSLPVVFLICGWWFWQDMQVSFGHWQRDRDRRALIVRQRLDHLEERVADLENRVDQL